jgi:hypothetical protein
VPNLFQESGYEIRIPLATRNVRVPRREGVKLASSNTIGAELEIAVASAWDLAGH